MSLANLMLTGDAYEISYLAMSLWNLKKNPNRMFLKLKKISMRIYPHFFHPYFCDIPAIGLFVSLQ